jgi:hypothetical protein
LWKQTPPAHSESVTQNQPNDLVATADPTSDAGGEVRAAADPTSDAGAEARVVD